MIFQFAATYSALSASRPELKSGTQGYRPDLEVPRFFCRARSGAAFVVLLVVRPLLALVGDSRPNSHVTDANAGSYHDAGARIVGGVYYYSMRPAGERPRSLRRVPVVGAVCVRVVRRFKLLGIRR